MPTEFQLPRIETIEVLAVRVPRSERNRIVTSYATLPDAYHALVRVEAEGIVGIGEAPAERWWTGEDPVSVRNAVECYLAPALIGRRVSVQQCASLMDAALASNPYAKAAVEMALWDVLGRVAGLPLSALLGGGHVEELPIKYVIGMVDPDRAAEEAAAARAGGFAYLKVKVGGSLEDDVARVEAVVRRAGEGVSVGVDANGGWTVPVALAALRPLAELGVTFVEQPVPARQHGAMATITERSPIPVVAHESIVSLADAAEAATGRLAHIWALTPGTHGGLLPTLQIAAVANAWGIPCLLGSTVELGVATAFLAHVGAATELIVSCPVPSDVLGPLYHDGDVVQPRLEIRDGSIRLPAGPGLGVVLDPDAVTRFLVDD